MAIISTVIYITTFAIFFFGQLLRVNYLNFSFPVLDIFIILIAATNFIIHLRSNHLINRNIWLTLFLVFAWLGLLLNLWLYQSYYYQSLFYLIRLTCLLSLFIFPPVQFNPNLIGKFLVLVLLSNTIFGLIQYFLWPDITPFSSLNWDPHLYRLVSTFFDPAFTALIYLFLLIHLYFTNSTKPSLLTKTALAVTYLAIALTYSRGTFLAFLVVFLFLGIKNKKISLFINSLIIISLTVILLPRPAGEGVRLERSSSIFAKIENYKEGISLFTQSPFIGYGYNLLPVVRQIDSSNHSASGFDSSLLTILTTTGLPGFILFILGIFRLYRYKSIYYQSQLIAVIVHSLFANSLLYPWILLLLAVLQTVPVKTRYRK